MHLIGLFLLLMVASVTAMDVAFSYPTKRGLASWYGEELRNHLMANGHPFNPDALTCACWHYPLGTSLLVTNRRTGASVVVKTTDRGPAKRLHRLIDLSEAAFKRIGDPKVGLLDVKIREF